MSVANRQEARNEMLALFKTAWDAGADTAGLPVRYGDIDLDAAAPGSLGWARVILTHATGGQASLSNRSGVRTWDREGFITVQVFSLFGDGRVRNDSMVQTVIEGYEGATTDGGIWFRNVRSTEIGRSGDWYQTNVIVEFRYDEIH